MVGRHRSPAFAMRATAATAALSALLTAAPVLAQRDVDPADYITIRKGTIPVVISAPHGGDKLLPGVPERQDTGQKFFTLTRDQRTAELAERLAAHLSKRLGGTPYIVIARFDRRHIDANRAPVDAYTPPGDDGPRQVYHAYHTALADAAGEIERRWGSGLLIDLHGQSRFPDKIIRGTRNGQTVAHLLKAHGAAAISGPQSVFGMLSKLGYPISPTGAEGDTEEKWFSGGHIVDTHGSSEGGRVNAIQVEVGSNYRTPERLDRTAQDLAAAIATFAKTYLAEARSNR